MEIFLLGLAVIWVIFAVVQDLKTNEIANWLNFSLIIVALVSRAFFSVETGNLDYVVFGFFGLGVGIIVAHLFYYARVFAGGDAKLLIALFVVLPVFSDVYLNLLIFFVFVWALMICGSLYSLIYSGVLSFFYWKEFKKEFKKRFFERKFYFYLSSVFVVLFLVLCLISFSWVLVVFGIVIFLLPYLYVYLKSVEDSALVREVDSSKVVEGDWLVDSVRVGGKAIKPDWEGLSKEQVSVLKNSNVNVLIKYGVPFSPAFLFALIVTGIFILTSNSFMVLRDWIMAFF